MDDLAQFARVKKVRASIVFDGAPDDFFPDGSSFKGVKIFYARQGSDADERIKQFVESSKERRTMIVVTSDRSLSDYCRRCGVQVLRSGEFRQRLEETLIETNAEQNMTEGVKQDELASWMRYFGVDESDDQ